MFTTILTILGIWNAGRKETGEGKGEGRLMLLWKTGFFFSINT
jgi:hypothetical protein